MTHASAVSYLPQGAVGHIQLPPDELQSVHVGIVRQNSAARKRQDFSADERQYLAVPLPITDHRAVLRENLSAWLKDKGLTRKTLKAVYVDGPKKGKIVSERSIGSILSKREDANSPSYDMIVAVCARLEIMPWHLLVPGSGPANPPTLAATHKERELHRQLERLRAELESLPR